MSGQQHAPAALYHGKDPVPILQEAGWASGPVWTGRKSRLHRDSIPDRPDLSQSLYRLSYPAHMLHVGLEIRLAEESVIKICVLIYIISTHIKQIFRAAERSAL